MSAIRGHSLLHLDFVPTGFSFPIKTRQSAALGISEHNGCLLGGGMNNRRKLVITLGAGALTAAKSEGT